LLAFLFLFIKHIYYRFEMRGFLKDFVG